MTLVFPQHPVEDATMTLFELIELFAMKIPSSMIQSAEAVEDLQKQVNGALASGMFPAFVHVIENNRHYRIPTDYWRDDEWLSLRIHDTLFAFDGDAIPWSLRDHPVVIIARDGRRWVNSKKIAKLKTTDRVSDQELQNWFEGLTEAQLQVKNAVYLRLARSAFPSRRVPRDPALTLLREKRGLKAGGRPKNACDGPAMVR